MRFFMGSVVSLCGRCYNGSRIHLKWEDTVKNRSFAAARLKWLWIWLAQFASLLAFSMLAALSLWLGSFVHGACIWVITPLAGFASALLATKKGLLNYAAWIAPPLMLLAGYWIVWGYPIGPGAVLLDAFVSLVGAAAGEVMKRQDRK